MVLRRAMEPLLADILRSRRQQIIAHWLENATSAASARGVTEVALANVMPEYVAALATLLERGGGEARDRMYNRLESHVATRIRQGFDLAEIVNELALLGAAISATWRTLPARQWPSARDLDRLQLELHGSMTLVGEVFRRHMIEDEQTEKRYARLLQSIASATLLDDAPPLRDRLQEVLALVMEAMGAQCAAFALFDLARDELVIETSVGLAALEGYGASLAPTSFVGQVAAHAEPTTVLDTHVTPLEIPDALRHGEIRSLLGVRLPTRNALLAVMFVGISQQREFTPREESRMESLGEQLVLHLANARLIAELHSTIDQLRTERELREQFVSVLAHDLRGPLSAAAFGTSLLIEQQNGGAKRPDLALRIQRSLGRADRMIRDLLDASRLRAGQPLTLQLEACDLSAIVQEVVEEARMLHGDRFVVDAPHGAIVGRWSEDELERAIWNLVTNAVKYGASGLPITLHLAQNGGSARVSVRNEGRPIPDEELATIFEAYQRATAGVTGTRGWGLGLTLVKAVAEAHGGHAMVRSDAMGTTFTIELPLDARTEPHDARSA